MPVVHELLGAATAAVDAADDVTRSYYRLGGIPASRKPDGSAVTEADLAAEDAIRTTLERMTPGLPVIAEEATTGGRQPRSSADGWVVDPIDGTENFSRGTPVWATLVALRVGGVGTLAVVSSPALGRRWTAARGRGAFAGDQPLRVSERASRSVATLAYGGLHETPTRSARDALLVAASEFRCAWGWGNFWAHVLVAEGAADAAVSHGTEIWDVLGPALLVSEAGGRWSDVDGRHLPDSGTLLTTNGHLHDDLVRDLGARRPAEGATL
jgi:histidinol-phosphatase